MLAIAKSQCLKPKLIVEGLYQIYGLIIFRKLSLKSEKKLSVVKSLRSQTQTLSSLKAHESLNAAMI